MAARVAADAAVDMLSKVDLFEGFTRKELGLVRGSCRDHSFDAGATIVREGDVDKRFFLLVDGTAEISADGTLLRVVGSGGTFGEIAVLDGGPRTATVTATTPVTALSLASFNMRALLKEHPAMALKLLEALAARLRAVTGPGVC